MKPESGDRLGLHFQVTFAGRLEYEKTLPTQFSRKRRLGFFVGRLSAFISLKLNHTKRLFLNNFCINNYKQISVIVFLFFTVLVKPSTAYSGDGAQLSGRVVDRISEDPIENTLIYLEPGFRYAKTNAQGKYEISDLQPGIYQISTKHVGYISDQKQQVEIKPGEKIDVNFYLTERYYSTSDAIVVTATRGKSLISEVPASVDVVGLETIELVAPQNMAEVLDNIQGVFIKDYGGIGGIKSISLRGSSAEQVLVLMDGQRLNNAQNGQVDFGTLSTEGIEKIEIIRGGSSALYGADAVGGVVNIITKKDHQATGMTGSINYMRGSFNSQSMAASANFHYGQINGSAGYKHLSSDGNFTYINEDRVEEEKENNNITSDDVFARMNWIFGDSIAQKDLDLSYKYYTSERGSPGTTDLPYYTARLWNTNQQFNTSLSGKVFNFMNDLKIQGYIHYLKTRYKNDELLVPIDSKYKNHTYGLEGQMQTVFSSTNLLTYGTGYRYDFLESSEFPSDHERHTYYIFVQDELSFSFASSTGLTYISLVPALRFDSSSDFGNHLSPKIGGVVNVGREWQTSVKINAGLNYRAPNFNELYWPEDPWAKGNPSLNPEHGFDWDIGLRLRYPVLTGLAFDLSYFDVHMKDLILWQSVGQIWMPLNVDKARNQGLEINLSLNPLMEVLIFSGNYTYLDAKNLSDDRNAYDKQLVYRPKHTANATIGLSWPVFTIQYRYHFVGRRHTKAANIYKLSLDPYRVSDIVISYHSGYEIWGWKISFQVKNFLDEQYEIIKYQPNPGREYRVNLHLSIN